MKKCLAFLLLGIYMLSFSEIHQLLKIPILIEHFTEHRSQDEGITLFAFLKMHYTGIFEVDEDYQRDQQLPFRTTECMMNTGPACECSFAQLDIQPQNFQPIREFILSNEDNKSLIDCADIFQPPRFAVNI